MARKYDPRKVPAGPSGWKKNAIPNAIASIYADPSITASPALPVFSQSVNPAEQQAGTIARRVGLGMSLPGVGGPTTTDAVAAVNAAAARAAAAAAPVVIKRTVPKKNSGGAATNPPAAASGANTPAAGGVTAPTGANDGSYNWMSDYANTDWQGQAHGQLDASIGVTRQQYAQQQAELKARQDAAAKLLSSFGRSVADYYSQQATKAGQGANTQAAAQAILGALGQRAFTGQSVAGIASNLAAAGNPVLGKLLAGEAGANNTALGGMLNRVLGTDQASTYLAQARNATSQAFGNAAAQGSYGQRLLAGLLNSQKQSWNDLANQKSAFEAKVPEMVQTRASELQNNAYKNLIAARAAGLDAAKFDWQQTYQQGLLNNAEKRIAASEAKAGSLSPAEVAKRSDTVGKLAGQLFNGRSTVQQKADGTESRTIYADPVKDYQKALVQLRSQVKGLPLSDYLNALNAYWTVPGQGGRPLLDAYQRQALADRGFDPAQVMKAASDRKTYDALMAYISTHGGA